MTEQELFAQVSLHEFVLEIMLANTMASLPKSQADEFLDDFVRKSRSFTISEDSNLQDRELHEYAAAAIQASSRFAEKVRQRADQIRNA
jgi:hypothetical protein